MKVSSTVTAVVGAAAGLAVGLGAYQAVAEPSDASTTATSTGTSTARPEDWSGEADALAPCEPPSHLVEGVCVTDVERTVVVYDAPAGSAQAARTTAPGRHEADGVDDEQEHEVASGDDDDHGGSYEVEDD